MERELDQLSPREAAQLLWSNTERLFRACLVALGPDHLMTRAFETAMLAKDPHLMVRAAGLLEDGPTTLKERVLIVLQRI